MLTSELTVEEDTKRAISYAKSGKSPGSHGLPASFYKTFKELLIPLLSKSFKCALKKKSKRKNPTLMEGLSKRR